jgi:hypothetical protein
MQIKRQVHIYKIGDVSTAQMQIKPGAICEEAGKRRDGCPGWQIGLLFTAYLVHHYSQRILCTIIHSVFGAPFHIFMYCGLNWVGHVGHCSGYGNSEYTLSIGGSGISDN